MKVPFLDLKGQYESIKGEIAEAIQQVIDRTAFAGGPFVGEFEEEFASFCDCRYAAGVSSGTSAIWLSLLGLGVGQGDEVITVPNTFIATAEAISVTGAKPVFVDIDGQTFNMRADLLEKAITPRTKAIIPVHLYGQMVDMDPVMEIARSHDLFVIEDACQAQGARYKGRVAGSIGDAGCFSFYPGKNLGAYGEAGAVVTNNSDLVEKINVLRDHGQSEKHSHSVIGWNARMDGFQGAILKVKLRCLSAWNEARRANAKRYSERLMPVKEVKTPSEADYAEHVFHVYSIRVENRDELMKALCEEEIQCGIHYPVPIHLQEAYGFLELGAGSFPRAEEVVGQIVSLPMYPELTGDQIDYVAETIRSFYARNSSLKTIRSSA
jgi:dTDP-4-amino-4,6-dideoxygalactose transaminase